MYIYIYIIHHCIIFPISPTFVSNCNYLLLSTHSTYPIDNLLLQASLRSSPQTSSSWRSNFVNVHGTMKSKLESKQQVGIQIGNRIQENENHSNLWKCRIGFSDSSGKPSFRPGPLWTQCPVRCIQRSADGTPWVRGSFSNRAFYGSYPL